MNKPSRTKTSVQITPSTMSPFLSPHRGRDSEWSSRFLHLYRSRYRWSFLTRKFAPYPPPGNALILQLPYSRPHILISLDPFGTHVSAYAPGTHLLQNAL